MPYTKLPNSHNDSWPVAVTSLILRAFERIVKEEFLSATQSILDPLWFVNRAGRSEDAVNTLLNVVLGLLDGANNFVRLLFTDFPTAFNCVQPHILADRLTSTHNIDPGLTCWLVDFLADRSQRVRVSAVICSALLSSTGCLQRFVLSPL